MTVGLQRELARNQAATVRFVSGVPNRASALEPGDLVRVVPNHSCVVSNLVDAVWLVDGAEVLERLEVPARGRIQ